MADINPKNVATLILAQFSSQSDTDFHEEEKIMAQDIINDINRRLEYVDLTYEMETYEELIIEEQDPHDEEYNKKYEDSDYIDETTEIEKHETDPDYEEHESPEKKGQKRSTIDLEKALAVYREPVSRKRSFDSMNSKLPGIIKTVNDFRALERYDHFL
uniref:Uncharacterized protein n=1 Tax=Acrobeloides nanus TaxID=290746 RepID=A0A914D9N0_9BILA